MFTDIDMDLKELEEFRRAWANQRLTAQFVLKAARRTLDGKWFVIAKPMTPVQLFNIWTVNHNMVVEETNVVNLKSLRRALAVWGTDLEKFVYVSLVGEEIPEELLK